MSDIVIKAENISKKYIIGHEKQACYSTFRDSIASAAHSLRNKITHPFSADTETTELEEFWALKNINFEIRQGDKVGIIGRNGAGKSTLLKILSRITEPTTGKIGIKGRVASLLEVGTGFHPELTGRENIFLNGAILGMTKNEIRRQFDAIVDFSGVEKFLDTPVKRYSSGMYVRLAFAVAAHLEPEVLIIDEVLAVGDLKFQQKCIGKINQVGNEGKTILFVSHDLSFIQEVAKLGIHLKDGQIIQNDNMQEVLNNYVDSMKGNSQIDFSNAQKRIETPNPPISLQSGKILSSEDSFCYNEEISFEVQVQFKEDVIHPRISGTIQNSLNRPVGSFFAISHKAYLKGDNVTFSVHLDRPNLSPGNYSISIASGIKDYNDSHIDFEIIFHALYFNVNHTTKAGKSIYWANTWGNTIIRASISPQIAIKT